MLADLWSSRISLPALNGLPCPVSDKSASLGYEDHVEKEDGTDVDEEVSVILGVDKPIETLKYLIRVDWERDGVCRPCVQAKRREWKEEIEDMWGRLDGWLGIAE